MMCKAQLPWLCEHGVSSIGASITLSFTLHHQSDREPLSAYLNLLIGRSACVHHKVERLAFSRKDIV